MTTLIVPPRTILAANLACMGSMMIWALGLSSADLLTGPLPPLLLTAIRSALAALVLLALWLAVEGPAPMRAARWGQGIWVGGIGFGLGSFLMIFAQGLTNSTTVAIITAALPVVGIALECLFDGRKLRLSLIIGLLLSVLGGLIALKAGGDGLTIGLGALSGCASVLCYVWGSRATVRDFPAMSVLGQTTLTISGAALVTGFAALIATALGGPTPDWAAIGAREVGAMLLFSIGSLAIAHLLWITAVGRLGVGLAGLHMNSGPFYVMLILFAFGGVWNWPQAWGAVTVGLGVLIAQGILRLPGR